MPATGQGFQAPAPSAIPRLDSTASPSDVGSPWVLNIQLLRERNKDVERKKDVVSTDFRNPLVIAISPHSSRVPTGYHAVHLGEVLIGDKGAPFNSGLIKLNSSDQPLVRWFFPDGLMNALNQLDLIDNELFWYRDIDPDLFMSQIRDIAKPGIRSSNAIRILFREEFIDALMTELARDEEKRRATAEKKGAVYTPQDVKSDEIREKYGNAFFWTFSDMMADQENFDKSFKHIIQLFNEDKDGIRTGIFETIKDRRESMLRSVNEGVDEDSWLKISEQQFNFFVDYLVSGSHSGNIKAIITQLQLAPCSNGKDWGRCQKFFAKFHQSFLYLLLEVVAVHFIKASNASALVYCGKLTPMLDSAICADTSFGTQRPNNKRVESFWCEPSSVCPTEAELTDLETKLLALRRMKDPKKNDQFIISNELEERVGELKTFYNHLMVISGVVAKSKRQIREYLSEKKCEFQSGSKLSNELSKGLSAMVTKVKYVPQLFNELLATIEKSCLVDELQSSFDRVVEMSDIFSPTDLPFLLKELSRIVKDERIFKEGVDVNLKFLLGVYKEFNEYVVEINKLYKQYVLSKCYDQETDSAIGSAADSDGSIDESAADSDRSPSEVRKTMPVLVSRTQPASADLSGTPPQYEIDLQALKTNEASHVARAELARAITTAMKMGDMKLAVTLTEILRRHDADSRDSKSPSPSALVSLGRNNASLFSADAVSFTPSQDGNVTTDDGLSYRSKSVVPEGRDRSSTPYATPSQTPQPSPTRTGLRLSAPPQSPPLISPRAHEPLFHPG